MTHLINWRFWAASTTSAAALALLLLFVDRRELWAALRDANYLYLVPAVTLYFTAQWFRALRWRYLLLPIARIPARRLYPVIVIGHLANNVLPARLGDIVRAVYLTRRKPAVSVPSSCAIVGVEHLYDGITLLALAAVASPVLLAAGAFAEASLVHRTTAIILMTTGALCFTAALALLTFLSCSQRTAGRLLKFTDVMPVRMRPLAKTTVSGVLDGLATLNSPRKHATLFLASLPVWLSEVGVYLIVAYVFDLDHHFTNFWLMTAAMTLVTVASNLITAIPATIGGIGAFQVAAQQTLVTLNVPAATAASYAVAVQLLALWLPVNLAGIAALLWHNVSLRNLTKAPAPAES